VGDLNPSPRKDSRFFEIRFAVDGAELQMIRKINPERHFNIVDVTDFFVLEIIHSITVSIVATGTKITAEATVDCFTFVSTADMKYLS
jgi:hypothetical protein